MAPLVSDLPIVLLALLLLEHLPPLFLRGVSLVGGLFVLYLAWGMWGRYQDVPQLHFHLVSGAPKSRTTRVDEKPEGR